MNCRECNDQLVAYLEGVLDDATALAVRDHLAGCAACHAEEAATRQVRDRLLRAADSSTGASLEQPVMDRILIEEVELARRLKMRNRIRVFAMGGIAAALVVSLTWAALQYGPTTATAAEIIARGVEAASNLKSIYIKCRMRTQPADNFVGIDLQYEPVDVELWKQYSPLKWKIAKPARVAVMDGQQTIMLIHNRFGAKMKGDAGEVFDTGWLHRLAAVDGMLSSELAEITAAGYDVKTKHEGKPTSQVTVEVDTKEQVGDYLKNKSFNTANSRRVYTFDPETGRLMGAKFYCRTDGKEVLFLEIVKIEYDPAFDDSVFKLDIPKDVVWFEEPKSLSDNKKYEEMSPAEAARTFFEACAEKDWDEVEKFWPFQLNDDLKKFLGGLEIIKLGEPFQAKPFPGWFVPYEIRFSNGDVRKHNLALRKDNPAHRWQFDGGL